MSDRIDIRLTPYTKYKYLNILTENYKDHVCIAGSLVITRNIYYDLSRSKLQQFNKIINLPEYNKEGFYYEFESYDENFPEYGHHHTLQECLNIQKPYIVIDLSLYYNHYEDFEFINGKYEPKITKVAHGNLLLINTLTHEIERFDPWGFQYIGSEFLDKILITIFRIEIPELLQFKYFSPSDFCKFAGPQPKQHFKSSISKTYYETKITGGFCSWWVLLYYFVRISHPDLTRSDIINWLDQQEPDTLFRLVYSFRKNVIKGEISNITI